VNNAEISGNGSFGWPDCNRLQLMMELGCLVYLNLPQQNDPAAVLNPQRFDVKVFQ
jgi:hypothetical protein